MAAYQLENSYQRKQPSKEKKRFQQKSVKKNGYTIGGTFPNIDRRSALTGYYEDTDMLHENYFPPKISDQATLQTSLVDGNRAMLSANVDHSLRFAILSIHPV